MKISLNWLQSVFVEALPQTDALVEALTFHVFEVDGVERVGEDDILDVKVTPNRGHDCLCHHGISKELAAILQAPLKAYPFENEPDLSKKAEEVSVSIDTPLCARYVAAHITGVKVGPSPAWLIERLASMGQRSINNVVDATNFIMFNLGQPLHAFDAAKLARKDGKYAIAVRAAREGEVMHALDEKEYTLDPSMLVIADANANGAAGGEAIGIAGIKGGLPAGITESTTDIIIESANFDFASVRKTSQKLKLRTDASVRFEQDISPELAGHCMRAITNLIRDLAGGELQGYIDIYPKPQEKREIALTLSQTRQVLGPEFSEGDIIDSFARLGFSFEEKNGAYVVAVPFLRLDLTLPEDLIEEVGRIQGYEKVPAAKLPPFTKPTVINSQFYRFEKIREFLVARGFSEVYTSVFADTGERVVLNKVDGTKPYLRTNLADGLSEALEKNIRNRELLGLPQVKIFEIGAVWKDGKEEMTYDLAVEKVKKGKTTEEYKKELGAYLRELPENPEAYDELPLSQGQRYATFSKFPYIVRDIAMWTPRETDEALVAKMIGEAAGELCAKVMLFDRFEKDDRVSLGFRLIFQSFERTLTDEEANEAMERVYAKMKEQWFEIR